MPNKEKKCKHEFHSVRSWYDWKKERAGSWESHTKIWKILMYCRKCGAIKIIKIEDEEGK